MLSTKPVEIYVDERLGSWEVELPNFPNREVGKLNFPNGNPETAHRYFITTVTQYKKREKTNWDYIKDMPRPENRFIYGNTCGEERTALRAPPHVRRQ